MPGTLTVIPLAPRSCILVFCIFALLIAFFPLYTPIPVSLSALCDDHKKIFSLLCSLFYSIRPFSPFRFSFTVNKRGEKKKKKPSPDTDWAAVTLFTVFCVPHSIRRLSSPRLHPFFAHVDELPSSPLSLTARIVDIFRFGFEPMRYGGEHTCIPSTCHSMPCHAGRRALRSSCLRRGRRRWTFFRRA